MPVQIPNIAITASAGSGKTHALVTRLVALLAVGVPPERLLAMTFTRAAAGEIFEVLVNRLAEAAAGGPAAARENARLRDAFGLKPLTGPEYALRLRVVIDAMHRASIGTLDSFFAAIVRAFPLELGIGPEFSILDPHALTVERERVLRRLLAAPASEADEEAQRAFREAFKRATFGQERKTVYDQLRGFVDERRSTYLQEPAEGVWGCPDRIWPNRVPWREQPEAQRRAATAHVRAALDTIWPDDESDRRRNLVVLIDALGGMQPETQLSSDTRRVFGDFAEALNSLRAGAPDVTGFKRIKFTSEMAADLAVLVEHGLACLTASRLENTRGLFHILDRFEHEYERRVRAAGKLTFEDLAYLLTRRGDDAEPGAGPAGDRLEIDYRLDAKFDHWALDEFQDTSRRQWAAVRDLVDEVLQDPSGQRTFFMVGDVKQAIYGWRGGDHRLMGEIIAHYDLKTEPLDTSFRSGPAVLDAVNAVFAGVAGETRLPVRVRDEWARQWHTHRASERTCSLAGFSVLLETPKGAEPIAAVAALLREVRPWARGLTAAVLVRSNDFGQALTAGLCAAGVPAVWEGARTVAEQPLAAALLALLRYLEHPGDRFALEHVKMTPAAVLLPPSAAAHVAQLEELHAVGFCETLARWLDRLFAAAPDLEGLADTPEMQTFLSAAQAFDGSGRCNTLDFCEYISAFTAQDVSPARRVQVMTIHRSKGLGFDLVCLPFKASAGGITALDGQTMLAGEVPGPDGGPQVQWLLDNPGVLARLDPVLNQALQAQMEKSCFEEICSLYVAMTRARQGLYLLVPTPPKSGETLRAHDLVRRGLAPEPGPLEAWPLGEQTCAVLYRQGERQWFAGAPIREVAPAAEPPKPGRSAVVARPAVPAAARRFRRRLPSREETRQVAAAGFFAVVSGSGREFGTALHALFRELEWLEIEPLAAVLARWAETAAPELADAVAREFRAALAEPEIAALFRRQKSGHVELWREKAFDIILDQAWITGVFDRVTIARDAAGRAVRAQLLDFKSDRVADAAALERAVASYTPQIRWYRRVLARLLDVPETRIAATLVFTHPRQVRHL